ncbi:phospholipase D family protein [Musicola keenii]|uniref:phospholipase D family protein n=1 Tax=Musicola keenii TaxID=2884250 RepID=UPI001786C25E
MFISSFEYLQAVKSIVSEENEVRAAVAFWGNGADSIFTHKKNKKVKIICNLASGATNPVVIQNLSLLSGYELRQHDRLHAKVIVGDKKAIVGSANCSSNGLNFEGDELTGWEEAGILTEDELQISNINKWFDDMWEESSYISLVDIEDAMQKWNKKRAMRSTSSSIKKFSLSKIPRAELLDRPVYLVVYREELSYEAREAYHKYDKSFTEQERKYPNKLPPLYEGWPELPEDAYLIDLKYGPRDGLYCSGVYMRVGNDIEFNYSDGQAGHLAICCKKNSVMDYEFKNSENKLFVEEIRTHWGKIKKLVTEKSGAKCISLLDIIDICRKK